MSDFVLRKAYFKVKITDGFFNHLLNHMVIDECSSEDEVRKAYDSKGEMTYFCNKISGKIVDVYQFPNSDDYFEMVDDSFVIPEHLFSIVNA